MVTGKGLVAFDYFDEGRGFRGFTSPVIALAGGPMIIPVPDDPEEFIGNVLETFVKEEGRRMAAQYADEYGNDLAEAMKMLEQDLVKQVLDDIGISDDTLSQIQDVTKIEFYVQNVERIVKQQIEAEIARHQERLAREFERMRRDAENQGNRLGKEIGRWGRDLEGFFGF